MSAISQLDIQNFCRKYKINEQVLKFEIRSYQQQGVNNDDIIKYITAKASGTQRFETGTYNIKLAPKEAVLYNNAFFENLKTLAKYYGTTASKILGYKNRGITLESAIERAVKEVKKKPEIVDIKTGVGRQVSNHKVENYSVKTNVQNQKPENRNNYNISDDILGILNENNLLPDTIIRDCAVIGMPVDSYVQSMMITGNYLLYQKLDDVELTYNNFKYPSVRHLVVDFGQDLDFIRPHIILAGNPIQVIDKLSILKKKTNNGYINYMGKYFDSLTHLAKVYKVDALSLIEYQIKNGEIDTFIRNNSKEHDSYLNLLKELCTNNNLNFDKLSEYAKAKDYTLDDYIQFNINKGKGKSLYTPTDKHLKYLDNSKKVTYNNLCFENIDMACTVMGLDKTKVQYYTTQGVDFHNIVTKLLEEQSKEEMLIITTNDKQFSVQQAYSVESTDNDKSVYKQDTRIDYTKLSNDAYILNKQPSELYKSLINTNIIQIYFKPDYQKPFKYKGVTYNNIEEIANEYEVYLQDLRLRTIVFKGNIDEAIKHSRSNNLGNARGKEVTYKGKTYSSVSEMSKDLDLPYYQLNKLVNASKIPNTLFNFDEEVSNLIYESKNNFITINGNRVLLKTKKKEYKSAKDFCIIEGITYTNLRKYLANGIGLDEIVEKYGNKPQPV